MRLFFQGYFSGFLFGAEEYDLGLKRICRFKALTSSFSSGIRGRGGGNWKFLGKTNNRLCVDIQVVKQDKITVILFVQQRGNSVQLVPFKNVLEWETQEKIFVFSSSSIKGASIEAHLLRIFRRCHRGSLKNRNCF